MAARAEYIKYIGVTPPIIGKWNSDNNKYRHSTSPDISIKPTIISETDLNTSSPIVTEEIKNFITENTTSATIAPAVTTVVASPSASSSSSSSSSSSASSLGTAKSTTATSNDDGYKKRPWKELIKSLSMGAKTQHVGKDEKGNYAVQSISDMKMPAYLQTEAVRNDESKWKNFEDSLGKCGLVQGSRLYKLRNQLIKQLKKLEETQNDPTKKCLGLCKEDDELMTMMQRLQKVMGKKFEECQLETFDKNSKLKLLAAKRAMMKRADFSFLHSECESDINCNPFQDNVIPPSLIDCSGLKEGEILFNSPQMAAIGKALAGKQRNGQSPAALGHASNLYPTGVIAPGTNPKQLWVNVCYLVSIPLSSLDEVTRQKVKVQLEAMKSKDASATKPNVSEVSYLNTRWVPANVMEQEKFETLQKLNKAITEQKRTILKVNRRIVQLQMQMLNVQGNDEWFDNENDSFGYSSQVAIEERVRHSINRARYQLQRKTAARAEREQKELDLYKMQRNGLGNRSNTALRRLMNM